MSNWNRVESAEALDRFLDLVGGFHDGVIKEVHWVNRDYVSQELSLLPNQLADARLLIQRQWENPAAVEIYMCRVWEMNLDTYHPAESSRITRVEEWHDEGEARRSFELKITDSTFQFELLFWRDASHLLGPSIQFGEFCCPEGADIVERTETPGPKGWGAPRMDLPKD